MTVSRRQFVAGAGSAVMGAALLGCGNGAGKADMAVSCTSASTGAGLSYCLLRASELRVAGGALLAVGEVALFNVDDSNAAIVARDAAGFYALSAICTHQCCVVTLCNGSCTSLLTNPGDCATTPRGTLVTSGAAFVCACHGSEFAADGSVQSGPADRALPAVALRREGNDLIVDLGTPAEPSARIS